MPSFGNLPGEGETVVATPRMSCSLGLGGLVLLVAAWSAWPTVAAEPRGLLRLPGWIESFHGHPHRDGDVAALDEPAATRSSNEATAKRDTRSGGILTVSGTSGSRTPGSGTPGSRTGTTVAAGKGTPGTSRLPSERNEGPVRRWFSERLATLPATTPGRPEPRTTRAPQADRLEAQFTPRSPAPAEPDAGPLVERVSDAMIRDAERSDATLADPADDPADDPVDDVAADAGSPPSAAVAILSAPDEMPILSIDPASFRNMHPGRTTRIEIESDWGPGEPFASADGGQGLAWQIEPFERVEATLEGNTVASIRIRLAEPIPVDDLARQLEIAELRTVAVLDDQGVIIGEVYPERGVILSMQPGTESANAIMIEPLDPETFVLRAEGEIESSAANALADLLYAVQLDPEHVRARRLLVVLESEQGRWSEALRHAEIAVRLDPDDAWTRIKLAGLLLTLDRSVEAKAVLDEVLAGDAVSPLVTAQVYRLLGRVALADDEPDHQAAVEHFAEAIRRCTPLATKKSPALQAAATEVLLDAHLGTALAIAEGTWQQKGRVIPKWIARSETLVSDFQGSDPEHLVLQLQLCRGVLAAAAASTEAIEPLPWVKRVMQLREQMGDTFSDPWRRRQLDWDVGLALADGLTAAQKRGDSSDMLDNATLTAAYLERGGHRREFTADERGRYGDLMFRIGIMHSLQRGDHATAVTWFDRVVPLWEADERAGGPSDLGRLGESYVSMAISYWQVDRRDDALGLSRRGVDLMVAAVDTEQLEERALAVAYGNLSTMYAEEGDDQQARTYAEMASRAEATGQVVR
jgi:tetratricopeptide (TPR) repeat protein